MDGLHRRILGFALVLSVVVSSYLVVVKIVNGFGMNDLFESFDVKSLRNPRPAGVFVVGDTLIFEVGSAWANIYYLQIYENSSLIFEKNEGLQSLHEVRVPLVPPTFNAGGRYVAVLNIFACNKPVLGAYFTDSAAYVFEVVSTETQLKLSGKYDGVMRNLCLRANLTDADDYPVINETVDFYTHPVNGRRRLTDGWISLGSSKTNSSGIASLDLAFNVPDGNYSFRAYYEGNENFDESESAMDAQVCSNKTIGSFGLGFVSEAGSKEVLASGDGNLTLQVSSCTPYATLYMNATATYIVNDHINTLFMLFFLDYINWTRYLGGMGIKQIEGPPYIYECPLTWTPNVTGLHKLIAAVMSSYPQNLSDIIASREVDLDIQPCPSNMVIHFSEAVYDDILPVTFAFSKPRPYEAEENDMFSACTLAPELLYNNASYVIDLPLESVPVKLYVNDTFIANCSTLGDGLACFPLLLNFSDVHFTLSLKGVVDDPSLLYAGATAERVLNFTKVRVGDVVTGGSDLFKLNYTMAKPGQGEEIYVGTENEITVEAKLFDLPVSYVPVSVLIGKPLKRDCTNGSGWVSIPESSSLLHVPCLYNLTTTSAYAACDVYRDGKIDMRDTAIVSRAFGSYPGHPQWNWRADINFDLKVDMRDVGLCARNFGLSVDYADVVDFSVVKVVFYVGDRQEEEWLNFWGYVSVPSGTESAEFYVGDEPIGAVVEFFRSACHADYYTNNVGVAEFVWVPFETGSMDCFLFVEFPSSFQTLVTQWSCVTEVNDPLCLGDFLSVGKRPLDISIDYTPDEPTLDDEVTVVASVFDMGLGEPAEGLYVDFSILGVSTVSGEWVNIALGLSLTNSSGVATCSFVPRDYCEEYSLFPWFHVVAVCYEGSWNMESNIAFFTIDTRYPTRLEFLDEDVMYEPTSKELNLGCRLVRADTEQPVVDRSIQVYMNDTWQGAGLTDEDGICAFNVTIFAGGVYFFRLQFSWGGDYYDIEYQDRNNVTFVIVAQPVPVFILFEVQPKEFRPGTTVTLNATVFNATSNEPLEDFHVWFYWYADNDTMGVVGSDLTDGEGVASVTWLYPESGVFVFWACVSDAQQIMSSPVTLTVGKETELSMNVEQGEGFDHIVSGRLLCDGTGVAGKQVVIKVNGTAVGVVETSDDGGYSVTLNLGAVDEKPTSYQVEAVFYGDDALNLTGLATLPNGTAYAVCTTLQYFGYKPSSNTAILTVEPQSTEVMTTTKTPEELQQEAEDSGWLTIWHEFSWWYPWYRCHFVYLNSGVMQFDIGISLLPFADIIQYAESFIEKIVDLLPKVSWKIVTGLAAAEFTALLASTGGPGFFLLALGLSIGTKAVAAIAAWNSIDDLISVFFGVFIPTVVSMVKTGIWDLFLNVLYMLAQIKSLAEVGFGKLYSMISIPVNIAYLGQIMQRLDELGAF